MAYDRMKLPMFDDYWIDYRRGTVRRWFKPEPWGTAPAAPYGSAFYDPERGKYRIYYEVLRDWGSDAVRDLKLVESDDPLEAGLEIFACPPGKRLSVMSLMSGGEQALTPAALIFGVFLANPAPVCVLDEVDAPLDDANVDRFCKMLNEMRNRTHTRFICITHNPVTMSRMDRLYGVTMPERGMSQLVSVDLKQAEDIIAA